MVSPVKFRRVIIPLIALLALQGVALPGAIGATPSAKPKPKISAAKKVVTSKKKTIPVKKKANVRKYVHRAPVRKTVLPSLLGWFFSLKLRLF